MELLIKIIGIAAAAAFLSIVLKKHHPEFSTAIVIATAFIVLFMLASLMDNVIIRIQKMAAEANINMMYISVVIKVIGISFLSEYCVAVLEDAGESALAKKVEFSGKLIIFIMALPVIEALFTLIISIF